MAELSSFDRARALALKQYAALEKQCCRLMRSALQIDDDLANAIFYQIVGTRTRYAIIKSGLDLKHEGQWKAWKAVSNWMSDCDTERNRIVHWFEDEVIKIRIGKLGDHGAEGSFQDKEPDPVTRTPFLSPGAGRSRKHLDPEFFYNEDRLFKVRDQFAVVRHIVNRFALTVESPDDWPWREIFLQAPGHLTPVQFLQDLNSKGYEAQLPPYDR